MKKSASLTNNYNNQHHNAKLVIFSASLLFDPATRASCRQSICFLSDKKQG